MKTTLRISLASFACATFLAGCATNEQGQLVIDPNKVNEVLAGALTPPPPTPPPVVVEEVYQPMPTDIYISTVVDRDVVIFGGNTYIWVVGPDGVRHRRFYAHGDHREDVFHRRDELHRVMMNHGGHLPDHAIAAHGPIEHPGGPAHPGVAQNHSMPGAVPLAHAAVQSKPAPAAKPAAKDVKKS
ncbi:MULTISPECIES: hypothetical protein [unclassified Paraburkholderia]|uniref:hypothetical protein n=1 Tax=unclassified Paraburkholderia TaxID=2615204 RepID=UPI0017C8ABE0|nr:MULTISPECIES: hypothetical protein [unclassified Paraburkholderia]MBB5441420.1 hypothetical protein [Paraburkholderia sp. WSM4177]MBB5481815.1 hypothetical protein [Paraburkholderia sp. WSM4180]